MKIIRIRNYNNSRAQVKEKFEWDNSFTWAWVFPDNVDVENYIQEDPCFSEDTKWEEIDIPNNALVFTPKSWDVWDMIISEGDEENIPFHEYFEKWEGEEPEITRTTNEFGFEIWEGTPIPIVIFEVPPKEELRRRDKFYVTEEDFEEGIPPIWEVYFEKK